jgi:hypothetical protein
MPHILRWTQGVGKGIWLPQEGQEDFSNMTAGRPGMEEKPCCPSDQR